MKDQIIKLADVILGEENRSFFDFLKYCFYGIGCTNFWTFCFVIILTKKPPRKT